MNDLGVIEDGSVLIKNSEIAAVGPTRRIENLKEARDAAVISAVGRVVMPGFIDAKLDMMPGDAGQYGRSAPVAKMLQGATTVLRSALHHGTTRAEIKVGGGAATDELRYLRRMHRLDTSGRELVRTWLIRPAEEESPEMSVESRRTAFEWLQKKATAAFVEVVAGDTTYKTAMALARTAAGHGMRCKLVWRGAETQPLADLLSEFRFHAVAGLRQFAAAAEEWAVMPTTFVFTGGGDLWSRSDEVQLRALLDANGAVAIASGYDAACSPVFNMQMMIARAVLQMKMTTEEAITAATINAAYASGIGKTTGSLEYKKEADLLLLNLADYRELPRQFGVNHVGMVIRSGSVVFNRIGWRAVGRAS
jgi:imidazolonepropionase